MWEKNPDRTVEAETEADDVAAAAVGGGAVIAVILGTGVTVVSLIMMLVESSLIERVGRLLLPSTAGSRPAAGIIHDGWSCLLLVQS